MWSGVTSIKRSLLQWHWEHPWWQPVQHDYIKLPQTPQNLVDTQWTHEQYASREGTECAGSTRPAGHRLSVGNHLLGVVCQNSMVRCELRAVPPGMLTAVFCSSGFNNNRNKKNRPNVQRGRTGVEAWICNLQNRDENFATQRYFL